MGDTSLDTNESSLSTSQATTEPSDDEDDELLALRIAALESIKIKESKAAAKSRQKFETEAPTRKPEFLIKSHTSRSNLLSIVTCEDEIEKTITPAPTVPVVSRVSPPPQLTPPPLPAFDASRPPPGFPRTSPPPSLKFPRSPPRRYSRSPRRWSSRSPPPRRRSPLSPYRPRRRSYSKSPPRRSSNSPPPRRRSRSPVLSSRLAPPRSPPPRRSPSPNKRSGVSPSPINRSTTPETEWETDTEGEEGEDELGKPVVEKPAVEEPIVKQKVDQEEHDASVDDVLKLDATAEVDEFSAFLNEFEDEVLTEKKIKAIEETAKTKKKERPVTEKKVVDGKRLRKKVKPVKEIAPRQRSRSMTRRRRSLSPRGKGPGWRRSPGRRYFSPGRGGRRGSFSPDKFGKSPNKGSPSRKPRSSNTPERAGCLLKGKERSSKGRDSKPREKARLSSEEKKSREEEDYKERLGKLPTPEREVMEARRKKFLKGVGEDGTKKISLKSSKVEIKSTKMEIEPKHMTETKSAYERVKKQSMAEDDEDELNADIGDTLDMFDDEIGLNKSSAKENSPPQVMKNVTDLRVQLHKKRRAQETKEGVQGDQGGKNPLLRSVSPSESRDRGSDGLEPDDFGPVNCQLRRKVVAPGKTPVSARLKMPGGQDSDRSPSPPPAKKMRKRRRADTEGEEETGLGGRRILVVKKDDSREPSPDINITTSVSPRKVMKKSLHQRLGDKIQANQFSEEEIYNEMLRQQDKKKAQAEKKELKKLKREIKKKEKNEKKKKKSKKEKKVEEPESDALSDDDFKALADVPAEDSDEELYRFFENKSPEDKKGRKRNSSGGKVKSSGEEKSSSRGRRSSGEDKLSSRGRRSSGELSGTEKSERGSLKERLGRKLEQPKKKKKLALEDLQFDLEKLQGSTDEESLDLLQKMKRKNEKRLRRMREIERDKLLFA